MKVYVIVTRYMNGIQDEAVFSTLENAQEYLDSRGTEGTPGIIDEYVRGETEEDNKVFTASWYDRSSDTHNFEGVYGTYDGAKKAAGEKGQVLSRGVDDRLG